MSGDKAPLEMIKGAELAAKEYKPSLLKRIKIAFQEYVKLLSYSTKSQ